MDDMDAESEEFGGKRKFFAGEFARYGWAKLMRSGLGGHEILNLYAEAIAKMPENPGIPLLFRDIFKNAYLPYRDPETLKMFLKVIDEFTYDHSERLGDAFEYLLSVLGSQGDAGQFRTPRHIIDFMVEIIDPKKNETVLDPACGTAGFEISSYKHILKANTNASGNSTLTPDEKGRLAQNFKGYDISPDMVRLSLVNMYLHGFADPHIYEYDTLTSQDRWNEYADVILANPPFMSPKGGIKPHNRFSVQSKRSEVLFVDYMAEHLRKMLVEEYLVAVVSPCLPECSIPTPASRLRSSFSTNRWPGRPTPSPSSRSKTTASALGRSAAPSTRMTCRRPRPRSTNTCAACGPRNRSPTSSPRSASSWRRRRSARMGNTTSVGSGIWRGQHRITYSRW